MNEELPIRTSVVLHDAGAANVVIATLMETGRSNWQAHMRGPAKKIWGSLFPKDTLYDTAEQAISGSELLITGTSWGSDIEHEARRNAQVLGIKSIAIIDHWVNYAERFIRNGEQVLPNEIWVTDKYAFEIATTTFPSVTILQIPNYYLERQLKEIASIDRSKTPELLYILEPIRSYWGRDTLGEFQALDYFISRVPELGLPNELVICLRPHPSDLEGKYDDWIRSNSNMNIKLDASMNISESLGRASWVAGCESFGLVIAVMAKRIVYCTLPPWAPLCRLPYVELIQLRWLHK